MDDANAMKEQDFREVSVVLPVYNEAPNLRPLHAELAAMADQLTAVSFQFLFVDDGSRDGSVDVLRDIAKQDARVGVIVFGRNFGQTAAMSCGMQRATGGVIVPMDADRQNDPADIPRLLAKMDEGFDCVSGWRRHRKDALFLRKLPSWIANAIISRFTGVSLHDYGCSLKAYRREIIQHVELYGEMHRFIPAYAAEQGARVTEVEVNHRPRTAGVSKYGLARIFKVMLDLLVVRFLMGYFDRPIHFFGKFGFLSLFLGVVAEGAAIVLKLAGLRDFVATPLPTVGAMLLVVGVQLILFGLLSEILVRIYFSSQDRKPYVVREAIGNVRV